MAGDFWCFDVVGTCLFCAGWVCFVLFLSIWGFSAGWVGWLFGYCYTVLLCVLLVGLGFLKLVMLFGLFGCCFSCLAGGFVLLYFGVC